MICATAQLMVALQCLHPAMSMAVHAGVGVLLQVTPHWDLTTHCCNSIQIWTLFTMAVHVRLDTELQLQQPGARSKDKNYKHCVLLY